MNSTRSKRGTGLVVTSALNRSASKVPERSPAFHAAMKALDQPFGLAQHAEVGVLVLFRARHRVGTADHDRFAVRVRQIDDA